VVVRLLVEQDDVTADSKARDSQTPLWYAAWGEHEAIVKLLVKRDNVTADSKDIRGQTSLSWQSKGFERKISGCSHDNLLKLSNGGRQTFEARSLHPLNPPTNLEDHTI
jgi:hypothetical protein